jgi:glycosyltransferase involved in cell wall biosynthesis
LLKDKRSIQIVSSIHTLLDKNKEGDLKGLFFSDYVVVHSEYARQVLAEKNIKNIVRIYPAVDEARFDTAKAAPAHNEVRIVYPGTYKILYDSYSLDDFCRIASAVKDDISNTRFAMACRIRTMEDKILEKKFRLLLRKYGLEESFTLLNTVDDMPSFFSACTMGIMPARRCMSGILEIPLVLLELAALGKPVAYGDVAPLGELEDKGLGIKISDGLPGSYAGAIIKCIKDTGYASMVIERSKSAVKANFTMDIAAGEYQRLYKRFQNKNE